MWMKYWNFFFIWKIHFVSYPLVSWNFDLVNCSAKDPFNFGADVDPDPGSALRKIDPDPSHFL